MNRILLIAILVLEIVNIGLVGFVIYEVRHLPLQQPPASTIFFHPGARIGAMH